MKTRDSGMPDEAMWDTFFDAPAVLAALGLTPACGDLIEFGCGYGTFTIPAARMVSGAVHALDIDPAMIACTQAKARASELENVRTVLRDFVSEGTGLPDAAVDYAMLFNILHCEEPLALLHEAHRVLRPGGTLAIMHWNHDPSTPRGPDLAIRPRPEQCRDWAELAGFEALSTGVLELPPYHYGLTMRKENRKR